MDIIELLKLLPYAKKLLDPYQLRKNYIDWILADKTQYSERVWMLQRYFKEEGFPPLESIYVEPNFKVISLKDELRELSQTDQAERQRFVVETQSVISFEEFTWEYLQPGKRIVILGNGGQGKSTLAERLALYIAGKEGGCKLEWYYIPVLIRLGELESAVDFRSWARESESAVPERFVEKSFDGSDRVGFRFVFILDGLDQVGHEKADDFSRKITSMARKPEFEKDVFIVASRYPTYYECGRIDGFNDELMLENFSKEQTIELYSKLKEHLKDEYESKAAALIEKLGKTGFDSKSQEVLLANPLYAIAGLVMWLEEGNIPPRAVELLGKLTHMLGYWTMQKRLRLDGIESEKIKRKVKKYKSLIAALAYRMFEEQKQHSATIDDKARWLGDDAQTLDELNIFGVIRRDNNEISFAHDRFLEYFAAYHLAKDEGAWSEVVGSDELRRRFREPLKLAPAIAEIEFGDKAKAQEMLRELYERGEKFLCFLACCEGAMPDDELHGKLAQELCGEFISSVDVVFPSAEFEEILSALAIADNSFKSRFNKPLIGKLDEEDELICSAVIKILGKTGDRQMIKPLLKKWESKHWRIHRAAAEALWDLMVVSEKNIECAIENLNSGDEYTRLEAIYLLGKAGKVEQLWKKLEDKDENIRHAAIDILGWFLKDTGAVEHLLFGLENEKVPALRRAIVGALGKVGDERAVEPLIERLEDKNEDKDIRIAAAEALGKIGNRRAIGPLEERLKVEEDEFVRGAIESALKRLRGRKGRGTEGEEE